MVNMIIRFVMVLIITMLYGTAVSAESTSLKQCFYEITEEQNSKELKEDLRNLNDTKIPIFVIINPNDHMKKSKIDLLEKLQDEKEIKILLAENKKMEDTQFVVKGYSDRLKILGLCNIKNNSLTYIGEERISFDIVETNKDPLQTMLEVNKRKDKKLNNALLVSEQNLNISTLMLAYDGLDGIPLEISDYIMEFKKPALILRLFTNIGKITMVFFSISIIIFCVVIIRFKKYSEEKFLDR